MTHTELRAIQDEIKFDAPSMALCLEVSARCYRNYLYGVNAIPQTVERAAKELLQINRTFVIEMPARIDARIDREFPNGIISEVSE
jgi:hypothetical protein